MMLRLSSRRGGPFNFSLFPRSRPPPSPLSYRVHQRVPLSNRGDNIVSQINKNTSCYNTELFVIFSFPGFTSNRRPSRWNGSPSRRRGLFSSYSHSLSVTKSMSMSMSPDRVRLRVRVRVDTGRRRPATRTRRVGRPCAATWLRRVRHYRGPRAVSVHRPQ